MENNNSGSFIQLLKLLKKKDKDFSQSDDILNLK